MRAVCIREFGDIDKLRIEDVPTPEPKAGEALIRVKAAALNHLDIWVRRGRPGLTLKDVHVMGSDAAGVVEKLGPGCEGLDLAPGREVVLNPGVSCMRCEFCLRGAHNECPSFKLIGFQLPGVFSEFAAVPAVNLFPKPPRLTWEEAAALPLSYLTAWRMLFERAKLLSGETVLIHGIGGGVAVAALQLCAQYGATAIVTSSSEDKLQKARALGARDGINYRSTADVAAAVKTATGGRGADVALDTVGQATLAISMGAVRRGGRIVTCGITSGPEAKLNLQQLYWNHISLLGSTMGSMEDMRRLVRIASEGRIKPLVDKVYPLAEAASAITRMEKGEQMGKIALSI